MVGKRGFTLVEILFVLIIAAGIMAYAVPAYRQAKLRAKYEAAQGILLTIYGAVSSLEGELASQGYPFSFPKSPITHYRKIPLQLSAIQEFVIEAGDVLSGKTTEAYFVSHGLGDVGKNVRFLSVLYNEYLDYQDLPATDYEFYAISGQTGQSVCRGKCNPDAKLCMCLSNSENSDSCFYGASMLKTGLIQRFANSSCSDGN